MNFSAGAQPILNISPPQRVLIIKPSAIGDIVHALPVLPRLRRLWPDAKISWLVMPSCAELVRDHPMVDDIILFERKRLSRQWYRPDALWDLIGFARILRRKQFDLVIDLQGLFRSALVAYITGAPRRVGFANAREGAPLFYTDWVNCSWENDHAVERYLKIAAALGCADGPVEFPLAVNDADRQYLRGLIPGETRYAVLLPGTNWDTKRWPIERFANLVKPIKDRFGLDSVVAGSSADAPAAKEIGATIDLTGKTNLRQIVALLERADLVIAGDTGPMHMAAALGRPLVALYGPTCPIRTGPFARMDSVLALKLPCNPCFSRHCSHRSCMQWLETDSVLNLAREQIALAAQRKADTNHQTEQNIKISLVHS